MRRISNQLGKFEKAYDMSFVAFDMEDHLGNIKKREITLKNSQGHDLEEVRNACCKFDRFAVETMGRHGTRRGNSGDTLGSLRVLVAVAQNLVGESVANFFFVKTQGAWKRSAVVLEKGYIGLGPRQAHTSWRPSYYFTRPANAFGGPPSWRTLGERWIIVGDYYIHRVMDGEAFYQQNRQLFWF